MDEAPTAAPGQVDERPPEAYSGTGWAHLWTGLFALVLLLLALNSIIIAVDGIQAALDGDSQEAQAIEDSAAGTTPEILWINSAFILVAFGILPTAWVALTRVKASATWRYLRMDGPDIGKRIAIGLGIGIGLWLTLIVINVIRLAITGELDGLMEGNETEQSPVTQALIDNLNWPLAIFIALVAGVCEELFFRGILQRWLGIWGQAAIFGITHAGYGTLDQIVFPFILGIVFGYLVKRGYGLWMPIAAHFMFNFVQLALALLFGSG
ncbi:MAG: lysostaphin resistance A-like protein [Thermoplasmatota archaeon]